MDQASIVISERLGEMMIRWGHGLGSESYRIGRFRQHGKGIYLAQDGVWMEESEARQLVVDALMTGAWEPRCLRPPWTLEDLAAWSEAAMMAQQATESSRMQGRLTLE